MNAPYFKKRQADAHRQESDAGRFWPVRVAKSLVVVALALAFAMVFYAPYAKTKKIDEKFNLATDLSAFVKSGYDGSYDHLPGKAALLGSDGFSAADLDGVDIIGADQIFMIIFTGLEQDVCEAMQAKSFGERVIKAPHCNRGKMILSYPPSQWGVV